jgi:NDP-mannose synthase
MQAIILAGGKGTRLKPYTTIFPKPLMPVGEKPILEIIIMQLKSCGFNDIIFTVGHLKELIMAYFGDGSRWDVNISYSVENIPLGTAGPLKLIDEPNENFLIMNGDVLTDIDYSKFMKFHLDNKAACSIATFQKPVKIDLGVLELNNDGLVTDYIEKPTLHYQVSMGVYAFRQEVLNFIPEMQYYDFPSLILNLLQNDKRVMSYNFTGHWLDIGRQEDYENAVDLFEKNKNNFFK